MIIEGYGHLEEALDRVRESRPDRRWVALGGALRAWARRSPLGYQLIYGTPIPGYAAPPETIAAALEPAPDADPAGAAAVLAELAALVGFVSLELAGHFVGTADPADRLHAALLERQVDTLGLRAPGDRDA